ncbi:MAG: hypothetical protein Q8W46_04220 [Candidatus Palauibacterales bacterium]|nr:hypothetical protein [Candidatus Palauibacterales bacterium]
MTDRETRQAILEAIREDLRSRVDEIMERFVHDAYEANPGSGDDSSLRAALADVSEVLAEGIAAQIRESEPPRKSEGKR